MLGHVERRSSILAIVLCTGFAAACAAPRLPETVPATRPIPSQAMASTGSAPTLFQHIRLFDGERVQQSVDVLVANGIVAQIAAHIDPPDGTTAIDGHGLTLLPGLIDAHVHAWPEAAQAALNFGVTTELDMFMDARVARVMRDEQRAGRADGRADVFSAGTLVTAPGGHGTEYGPQIPTLGDAADADAFVDARLAEGSAWIKIVYDDGRTAGRAFGKLSEASLRATVAAARRRGRLSVVHISSLSDARTAIDAGASGLAHLFTDSAGDAAFAAEMRRQHAFAIPTLTVLAAITNTGAGIQLVNDPRLAPYLSRQDRMVLSQSAPFGANNSSRRYSVAESTIRVLHRAGVPLLAGTDAGNPGTAHGAAMHLELELLVAAGLTPLEALRTATSVPAHHFALRDRGRVVRGARADLLLIEGDPTSDIRATRAIRGVWKGGIPADRDEFRQRAAESLRGPGVPPGLGEGWISRFENGSRSTAFGSGWSSSTDAVTGGNSAAALDVVDGALEVHGTVGGRRSDGWAGAMFSPGATPFAAADLSTKREIVFRARGSTASLQLIIFAESRGRAPLIARVSLRPEWQEFAVPFSSFGGMDGRDVQAIIFSAGPTTGAFRFALDDVRLR